MIRKIRTKKIGYFVQILSKGRFGKMISFELHLEKWHEKTPKLLWFRGFSHRYLFRCAMLVVGGRGLIPATARLCFAKKSSGFRLSSIFWSTAPANLLPSSATGSGRSRDKLFALRAHNPTFADTKSFLQSQKKISRLKLTNKLEFTFYPNHKQCQSYKG